MKNSNFFGAPPLGVGVFGKLLAARKRKDRQRNRLGRSPHAPASQEPKARWRSGSADRTAPEQIWQAPGLRELRLAESEQILPPAGNRKPASDRGHWLQPVPCSSRRRSCPGRERGDRQSSVPADSTPSQTQPTGRRIGGYDYKTESFQRPRAEHYTRFREMKKFGFFWCPSPGGRSVREITSREETERPPEESTRQIPARSRLSQEPKARWRCGSADRTAPEQVSQAPGVREFRFAESQQILPLIGNRKPASDRGHWLQPAPCSSRRRSCPGRERGDRQSSVSADSTPSRASPTGRRIAGYDYKTEAIQ